MNEENRTQTFTFRVTTEEREMIEEIAKKMHRNASDAIRQIIQQHTNQAGHNGLGRLQDADFDVWTDKELLDAIQHANNDQERWQQHTGQNETQEIDLLFLKEYLAERPDDSLTQEEKFALGRIKLFETIIDTLVDLTLDNYDQIKDAIQRHDWNTADHLTSLNQGVVYTHQHLQEAIAANEAKLLHTLCYGDEE